MFCDGVRMLFACVCVCFNVIAWFVSDALCGGVWCFLGAVLLLLVCECLWVIGSVCLFVLFVIVWYCMFYVCYFVCGCVLYLYNLLNRVCVRVRVVV